MTIGIDIDSTITKTGTKTLEYLNIYAPEYNNYHDLPPARKEEFLSLYVKKIHENCELKEGVKEAFDYFHSKGYKIIIITARSYNEYESLEETTINYFKEHNLKYDKIFFNKDIKGECAYQNNVSIFIDDKEENLDDINSYGIECLRFSTKNDSKYKTFSNWHDIINYISCRKD